MKHGLLQGKTAILPEDNEIPLTVKYRNYKK